MSDYTIIKLVISDSLHYTSRPSILLTSEFVSIICPRICCLFLPFLPVAAALFYKKKKTNEYSHDKAPCSFKPLSAFITLNVVNPQKQVS